MMTRKGFFAMMAAAIAGTKVAPAAARYAVVDVPKKYTMAAVPTWHHGTIFVSIKADQISSGGIVDIVNHPDPWMDEVRVMNDGNVEWSSAEYTINLRATGDGDMIDDSGNYWQIR